MENQSENSSNTPRPTRTKRRRGIYVLPNLVTTAALFCGFYSIVHSIQGDFSAAAWGILFAGVFDALDGRVARLTRTHSDFGIAYDSLSDVASFGMAPAVLAYTWTLHNFGKFGWGAAFLFFACGALRLARFNTQMNDEEKKHFQGLPIPAAAYFLASYNIFHTYWKGSGEVASVLTLIMAVTLGLLMVSNVHYPSFKLVRLAKRQSFLALVGAAVFVFIVASAPATMIFVFTVCYVIWGLIEELLLRTRHSSSEKETLLSDPDGSQSAGEQEPFRVISGTDKTS